MGRPRVLLPDVIDTFISPLSEAGERAKGDALQGRQVPGRWGVRMNHYTTDLFIVVQLDPHKDKPRYRKRRVHAWARTCRKNRKYFVLIQGRRLWLDHEYFCFLRSLARPAIKALTYETQTP